MLTELVRSFEKTFSKLLRRADPDDIRISINTTLEAFGVNYLRDLPAEDRQRVVRLVCSDFGVRPALIGTEFGLRWYIIKNANPNYQNQEVAYF